VKKASIKVTFREFLDDLEWYAEFLNTIHAAQRIVRRKEHKHELFEALALKIYSSWEVFVEDLLIDCLNSDTSKYAEYTSLKLPKHMSRDQCVAMIVGLGYLDLRSTSDIKRTAKHILVDACNPFKHIPNLACEKIDDFVKIRNYLSHYSFAAERTLSNMYRNRYKLHTFRTPGAFLFARDPKTKQTRLGNYIDAFVDAATHMATFLNVQVP
jgi:hypothetical protein